MLYESENERTEKLWGIVAVLAIVLAVVVMKRSGL